MPKKKKEKYESETYRDPRKKKKRSRFGDVVSIIVIIVALVVLVVAGYMLYGYYQDYRHVDETYDNLADLAENETDDLDVLEAAFEKDGVGDREMRDVFWNGEMLTLPVMKNPIDFDELMEINPDLVGWLKIRAIDLSYPVVQGEDNDYYLHNSFEKEYLFAGCLFENYENKSDFSDRNTIIYGHNMRNGSMFGNLKKFRDEEIYNKSKYFWIYTKDIIFQYRIISARVVGETGLAYTTQFKSKEEFQEFLDAAMENSEVDNSTVDVTTDDRIVTLSTCTGDSSTRFILQGKLVQMYASE